MDYDSTAFSVRAISRLQLLLPTKDFLAVTNPGLLHCFEAEKTFYLDKDDLDWSQPATNMYAHDGDSGVESSEGETVYLLSHSMNGRCSSEQHSQVSFQKPAAVR